MTARAMLVRAMLAVFVVVAAAGVAAAAAGVAACGGGRSEIREIRRDSSAFYDTGPFAAHVDEYLTLAGEPPSTALAGFGGEGALPVKKMLAWVEGMAGGQ